MQKNFVTIPVCILFAGLQEGIMYYAGGDTPTIEILSLAFTIVCPILLTIWHPLNNDDSAGNNITTIPAVFALLQIISTHENNITTGLHQQ